MYRKADTDVLMGQQLRHNGLHWAKRCAVQGDQVLVSPYWTLANQLERIGRVVRWRNVYIGHVLKEDIY